MKFVGIILLVLGVIFLINANHEPATTWSIEEYEKSVKEIEFAEDAYIPCLTLGGVFLAVGIFMDSKKPKYKYSCGVCGSEVGENQEFCSKCGNRLLDKCPNCGELYDGDQTYCPKCGKCLKKLCPYCSAQLKGNEKFCRKCGNQVQ